MLAELAPLSDLERVVLNKRLGINGEDYRSVRRTAADLHIPKSTVFDLEKRARGKIIPRIRIEK
jgi:DNA-directed RNA polymerase sigma subunit (sigma70/sigma32)